MTNQETLTIEPETATKPAPKTRASRSRKKTAEATEQTVSPASANEPVTAAAQEQATADPAESAVADVALASEPTPAAVEGPEATGEMERPRSRRPRPEREARDAREGTTMPNGRDNRDARDARESREASRERTNSAATQNKARPAAAPAVQQTRNGNLPHFTVTELEAMPLEEMYELARQFGLQGYTRMKRPDLITRAAEGSDRGRGQYLW
ncbi:MAG: hypothetical protein KatS3mg059_1260 [Thermomicrobiales bacterium]|nr:MAG: hypothetical protein KatS3mg059_1260 [Thermomicrobiales bacterium]